MKLFCQFILFLFCSHIYGQSLLEISLKDAKVKSFDMDEYFEHIDYIFLETTKECLLENRPVINLTDKYIVASNFSKGCYLFDRMNGKFIREVSKFGQGPDEYNYRIVHGGGLNEEDNTFYVDDRIGWKAIDLESNVVKEKIVRPANNPSHRGKYRAINNPYKIGDNKYLGHTNNIDGKIPYMLVCFNNEGVVLKEYPNYLFFDKKGSEELFNLGYFHKYKDDIFFKQLSSTNNDTLYRVTEKELVPYIVFKDIVDSPQEGYEERITVGNESVTVWIEKNPYSISRVWETDLNIFFYVLSERNNGVFIYDKQKRELYKSENKSGGFKNNRSNVPDFIPLTYSNQGFCVGYISAEHLLEHIESNPFPEKNRSLREKIEKVREDDNPIIVIAKIKK